MSTAVEVDDIQSLVFSGHSRFPASIAIGLTVRDVAAARTALGELARRDLSFGFGGGTRTRAVQVLLTSSGLRALGASDGDLAGFSRQFQQGIVTLQRSRALGDANRSAPSTWAWSDVGFHAVLLIYAPDQTSLKEAIGEMN